MKKEPSRFRLVRLAGVLLLLALTTGCTAKMRMQRHLGRAENYFKAGEYEKAKIEYMNVLGLDSHSALAFERSGTIWMEQGAPLRAGPFLYRASELVPTNVGPRIKLGRAYLAVGASSEAYRQAAIALQQSPANAEALLLLASSSRTIQDLTALDAQVQKFPDQNSAEFQLASATLALRKQDSATAESILRRAVEAYPKSPLLHTGMATFHLVRKDTEKAGEELRAAADNSPLRSSERVRYAEFKASVGQVEEAAAAMNELTNKVPDFIPAWRLLAQIALSQKKFDDGITLVEKALKLDSENADCRIVEAALRMAQGDGAKAVQGLQRVDKAYPNVPAIQLQLARAHLMNKDIPSAAGILNQAITAHPDFTDAVLLMAEINLRAGDFQAVANAMQTLLKKQPHLTQAELFLADANRGLGQFDETAAIYRGQIDAAPQNAQAHLALGLVLRQQKKLDEAQVELERALELDPNPATADQLVDVQLERKDSASALKTVEGLLAKTPNSASMHDIEGKIFASRQQWDEAEAAFSKAIELDPTLSIAYDHLIAVYLSTNRMVQAAAKLETVAQKTPVNPAVLMILGLVYDKMNDYPKASDAYEKLLALKPDFAPALNNLAYILSEKLPQLDRAAELARKARTQQPSDPSVADTLGWILYKQGDFQQASTLLQEAAAKLPDVAEVQFHVGMANYMMGSAETARVALEKAANAKVDFPGKEEARKRLALLAQGGGGLPAGPVSQHDGNALPQSNDVVALVRAGEAFEKQGDAAKAADAFEQALKANSKLLPPALRLAELYAGPLNNKKKALEYGKKARELAPTDPEVARVLGRVAYRSGNFPWAHGLLQESARRLPDDALAQYDFAWAAYSVGKIPEAQQAMQRVANAGTAGAEAEDAKSFLAMVSIDSANPDAAAGEAENLLKAKPEYVPALMVAAQARRLRGETKAAEQMYGRVLQQFPEFAPAQRELARILAADPANNGKAYELATKARKSLPDDPELGLILGTISYNKKDYTQAIQAFQQSARKRPLDADSMFYLGMSQVNARQSAQGRQTLQQAIAAGLDGSRTEEARRMIEQNP